MGLIDSHCHLNFEPMGDDLPAVLERSAEAGVDTILCVSVDIETYPEVLKIAVEHEHIYASVGVHPNHQDVHEPSVTELLGLAKHPKVIAIGETGLDYFRSEGDLDWQHQRFIRHIDAAKRCDKPLIIHTRSAADDTLCMLRDNGAEQCGAVMHCFAEDWEVAKQALDLGFYLSFSGIVTFNSAKTLQEVARKAPADRILVETDAPYLAPAPMRGKPNQPAFVRHTAEFVAELRGQSLATIAETTSANFYRLFKHASAPAQSAV